MVKIKKDNFFCLLLIVAYLICHLLNTWKHTLFMQAPHSKVNFQSFFFQGALCIYHHIYLEIVAYCLLDSKAVWLIILSPLTL